MAQRRRCTVGFQVVDRRATSNTVATASASSTGGIARSVATS